MTLEYFETLLLSLYLAVDLCIFWMLVKRTDTNHCSCDDETR